MNDNLTWFSISGGSLHKHVTLISLHKVDVKNEYGSSIASWYICKRVFLSDNSSLAHPTHHPEGPLLKKRGGKGKQYL